MSDYDDDDGEFWHDADDFMTDPPAPLTEAGLNQLVEIYHASGDAPRDSDGWELVELEDLASFNDDPQGSGQVRRHLLKGGYLGVLAIHNKFDLAAPMEILGISLSAKAYDALETAGVVTPKNRKSRARKK